MAQVTLNNPSDTWIDSTNATTNFGTNADMYVGEYGFGSQVSRALIKWDLSSIPSGSTITGATMRLRDIGTNLSTTNRSMRVYRCLRAWVENEATWNVYSTGNSWGTAGAGNTTSDREASDIGSVTMPATEVAQYYEITLTASAVQEMFNGTIANNGFVLKMDTETDDMHRFYTVNNGSLVPELVVDYDLPVPVGGFYYMSQ